MTPSLLFLYCCAVVCGTLIPFVLICISTWMLISYLELHISIERSHDDEDPPSPPRAA